MMEAFKPRGFIFLHACANCKYAKTVPSYGSARNYICTKEEHSEKRSGTHICDVDIDGIGEQLTWLDDFDTMKKEE